MKMLCALVVALVLTSAAAAAQTLSSVSKITFGPAGTLFAADWRTGRVYAFRLGPPSAEANRPFNLADAQARLARASGTSNFRLTDLAMRPGSSEAYVALESGPAGRPAIVRLTPSGATHALDLRNTPHTSVALVDSGSSLTFWDKYPLQAYTVTDMKWHAGKLYVAGLARQNFSSTLRVVAYPFGRQSVASVEMYHTLHNQWETRAPIRAMTFANVRGVDTLLASYLCSPLVSIPVAALRDGAHVKAKTLAELGVAGIPLGMLVYDQPDMRSGKSAPFVLVNERFRPAVAIPVDGIAKANAGAGITTPPDPAAPPAANLGALIQDYGGVLRIDNQDAGSFVALRRNLDTGATELVSFDKRAAFRLSDADVSEYDFPDYRYDAAYQQKYILPLQNMLKKEEGFSRLVVSPRAP